MVSIAALAGRRHRSGTESPDKTAVTTVGPSINASPTPGSAGFGNVLAITSGGGISVNGSTLGGAGVTELYYVNHTAYQFTTDNAWYGPITATSTGTGVTAPVATITGITLSNNAFTTGASGTVIGTIAVAVSGGSGSFTGTLSLTGTNAASFKIVGSSLETNGTVTAGSYSLNIVATQAGAVNSGFSQVEALTASTSGSTGFSARPPAIAAGMAVVWLDDFTTNSIGASNAGSGFNWYLVPGRTTSDFVFHTATTAAQISNGNSSGGGNASPNGGVLTFISGTTSNATVQTCPQAITGNSGQQGNSWLHGYFEAYIQFQHTTQNPNGATKPGWPAYWSWQTGPQTNAHITELDFLEEIGGNILSHTFHNWFNNYATDTQTGPEVIIALSNFDSEWHTYGFYWVANGDGTGTCQFYIDNIVKGPSVKTGPGTNISVFENGYQYLILGTGPGGWQMNVDWVRVWQ